MPYIKPEAREQYKEIIDKAVETLSKDSKTFDVGDLNYLVSCIVWKLFDNNPRYRTANDLVGALECIKLEFIRRRVNEYEDSKIKENSDIIYANCLEDALGNHGQG
jgi:hypothetical protein